MLELERIAWLRQQIELRHSERQGGLASTNEIWRLLLVGIAAIAYLIRGDQAGYTDLRVFMPVTADIGLALVAFTLFRLLFFLRLSRDSRRLERELSRLTGSDDGLEVGTFRRRAARPRSRVVFDLSREPLGRSALTSGFALLPVASLFGIHAAIHDVVAKDVADSPLRTWPWRLIASAMDDGSNLGTYLSMVYLVGAGFGLATLFIFKLLLEEVQEDAREAEELTQPRV